MKRDIIGIASRIAVLSGTGDMATTISLVLPPVSKVTCAEVGPCTWQHCTSELQSICRREAGHADDEARQTMVIARAFMGFNPGPRWGGWGDCNGISVSGSVTRE